MLGKKGLHGVPSRQEFYYERFQADSLSDAKKRVEMAVKGSGNEHWLMELIDIAVPPQDVVIWTKPQSLLQQPSLIAKEKQEKPSQPKTNGASRTRNNRHWTKSEEAELMARANLDEGRMYIAEKMGRSVSAVYAKLTELRNRGVLND
jgi:hypothetical protein